MGESLPHCLCKKILLFTALLFGMAVQGVYSQSTGDIAFIGFNGDSQSSGDAFSVVLYTSYSANEEVHFSSQEWDGSSFEGSGGDFTWIAPSGGATEGTVLVFEDVNDTPSVNFGSITDDANMNLSGSGDIIYAYTGTDKTSPNTPFLGAIASDTDLYNKTDGTEGTLANTGLTQAGYETILLTDNIDVAEFTGDRSGNTQNGYLAELNNVADNWQEENGSGSQADLVLPFDDTSFTLISAPTIAFTASSLSVDEMGSSVDLTVELVEANSTAVDVDVVFLPGSSTAGVSDIDSYSTTTVSYGAGAASGAIQTVTVNLTDDGNFEGTEKAVFQLQNNTAGSIIEPSELTLSISDDDAPDIVFNEINAEPGDDANGDGTLDSDTDEFVELVNNETADIDISGWAYNDGSSSEYIFPEGSVIPAGQAILLFDNTSGTQPQGNFGGAQVFSDAEIGLNNSPETLTLKDAQGNTIATATYGNDASGEANVLDPEITGNSYIDHSTATGAEGALSSPGTQVDGTPFGSKHAIAFRGTEGWRMISSPVQGTSFNDFFSDFWMQGITGSDAPNDTGTLFSWTESGGGIFSAPTNMTDNLTPGQGYIVYVFEDDEYNTPGIQGGFPKVVNSNGTENSGTVNVSVSSTDDGGDGITGNEGWNMLGNPFAADVSVTAVLDALEAVDASVNANVYVWDHEADDGNGDWVTKVDGDLIAPFQGFFVRFTSAFSSTNATFDKTSLEANTGTEFYKEVSEDAFNFELELHGEQYYDTYSLAFNDNGTVDLDRYDAYKLFSLNSNSINLYSTLSNNRIQKNVLPRDLESALEIPLLFEVGDRESLTFEWKAIENLPNGWTLTLVDKEMNREVDLTSEGKYQFTRMVSEQQKNASEETLLNKSSGNDNDEPRFVLSVKPKQQQIASDELPESAKLNPNYPNPFNPQTTIPYQLSEDAEVKLTVWNMIGQKVATLVDGFVEAGTHQESWNASNMPSGIYIARFEVAGEVFIRKMTLIK